MKRLSLICAALVVAAPAIAGDLEARQGADWVRITDDPCSIMDKIADAVPQGARGYLRMARANIGGQDLRRAGRRPAIPSIYGTRTAMRG